MFMKNKRSIPKKYIVIGIIVLIIIIFVIFSFTLKEDRKLNKVESFIRDAFVYTEKIISYPVRFVSGKINDYNELDFWNIAALTGDTVSQVYNHNITTSCEYCVSGYLASKGILFIHF